MTVEHGYPVTLYHTYGNEELTLFSTDKLVWNGNIESSGGCLYSQCSNDFVLTNTPQKLLMVNWDRNYNRTITIKMVENSAVNFVSSISLILMSVAMFTLY
jgi:hypothetical protein